MYAKVLVDIKHEDVNRFFDYAVPASLEEAIEQGLRVVVPFGHQTRLGYVIEVMPSSEDANKEILEVLDIVPTIQPETFKIIEHMIKTTNELYSVIFETVIPPEIGLDYYHEVTLLNPSLVDEDFKKLFNQKGLLYIARKNHQYDALLRKYKKCHAISITPFWQEKVQEKRIYMYHYNHAHSYHRIDAYPALKHIDNRNYSKKQLLALGLTEGHIQTLLKHDVLMREKEQVERTISHVYARVKRPDVVLTKAQQTIYDTFYEQQAHNQTFLLKGVTGSGKTELYIKWINDVIKDNKQVLILVPEIALIAPLAKQLESAFGDIMIYHSQLSKGERFDQYMKLKTGKIRIVLGTRSAVFLPLDKLGLIILDEEHDRSYQQAERCAYDARDIAFLRSSYHGCPCILGSATPSIKSMYQARMGNYYLLQLNERPFGISEPHITMVDMREELRDKHTSMFSRKLKRAIDERLEKHEQVMVLFNRKGYAPFVMCRQCGDVPRCPTCDVALTYYQHDDKLKCHYCGYEIPFDHTCHVCHQPTVKSVGVGIEQVEKAMQKTFPNARIMRMDANVTKTKDAHEKLWHAFQTEDADILLGTQMIAKGFDFPKVTLVGVLMADLMLKTPSYRASEDAFMLLMQVAGRSGRSLPGEVIIQGYDLDHYALKDVSLGYDRFYEEALYERKVSGYEPFNHVYQISAEGHRYLKTYQQLFYLKKLLLKQDNIIVLGPVPAYIKKKGDQFRFMITIKTPLNDLKTIFDAMHEIKDQDIWLKFHPFADMI